MEQETDNRAERLYERGLHAFAAAAGRDTRLLAAECWQEAWELYREQGDAPAPAVVGGQSNIPLVDHPLTGLEGDARFLREWKGKTVLVNFWATWCAPCREEIPLLQKVRDSNRHRNFEVVGVAFDEQQPVVAFRDEFDVTYPLLLALADPFSLLGSSGNEVGGLPHSILLDGDGSVLASHTGILTEDQLEEWLKIIPLP